MNQDTKSFELDCDLPDGVGLSAMELRLALDAPGLLKISLGVQPEKRRDLQASAFPQKAVLSLDGKQVFKGALSEARSVGWSGFEWEFRDPVEVLSHSRRTGYVKSMTLEEVLGAIAAEVGLRARYFGDFGQEVGGRDVSSGSGLERLLGLSEECGFHFYCHSVADELLFVKLGSYRERTEVNQAVLQAFSTRTGVQRLYQNMKVHWFDSDEGQPETQKWEDGAIYEGMGFLTSHSSFERRLDWSMCRAGFQSGLAGERTASSAISKLLCSVRKQAVGMESLVGQAAALIGVPGDAVNVTGADECSQGGEYLLRQVMVSISSAKPIYRVELARA